MWGWDQPGNAPLCLLSCLFKNFYSSLLNLLPYCSCFMFWLFGWDACGMLAPRPGVKPAPLAQEGEVLDPGPRGTSFAFPALLLLFSYTSCPAMAPHTLQQSGVWLWLCFLGTRARTWDYLSSPQGSSWVLCLVTTSILPGRHHLLPKFLLCNEPFYMYKNNM